MKPGTGRRPNIFAILIPVVTAATIALAFMQFTWISRAAESERVRHVTTLFRDGSRAVNVAFDELRLVAHLVKTAAMNAAGTSGGTIDSVLESWESQSAFPRFVRGVWMIRNGTFTWHPASWAEPARTGLPAELEPLSPGTVDRDSKTFRERAQALGLAGYSVLPFIGAGGKQGIAVIELDPALFFSDVLPYHLSTELAGYSFSVSRNPNAGYENPGFGLPTPPEDFRRPGIVIPVPGFYLGEQENGDRSPEGKGDPDARSQGRTANQGFPGMLLNGNRTFDRVPENRNDWFRIRDGLALGRVEIQYIEGAINRDIEWWIFSNTAISAGVLLLLLLCLTAVSILYRRTGAMRMKEQEFVALMSHELRLPVTVIKAVSDNLAKGIVKNPERIMKYGTELGAEAERLSSMIEGILLYSGLQSGSREVERSTVDVKALTEEVTGGMKEIFERKHVRLETEISAGSGEVLADGRGLRTILGNLLMNAVIHGAPQDPGEQPHIRLIVTRRPFDILKIVVEDNGNGIPKREQRSVFLPFRRTQTSIRNQVPGSGLGLHIIRRVALLSGGDVILESPYPDTAGRMKNGCRFTVTLRIREAVDA